jgi:hypothetical protein
MWPKLVSIHLRRTIEPLIEKLEQGIFEGDRLQGFIGDVYKVRDVTEGAELCPAKASFLENNNSQSPDNDNNPRSYVKKACPDCLLKLP